MTEPSMESTENQSIRGEGGQRRESMCMVELGYVYIYSRMLTRSHSLCFARVLYLLLYFLSIDIYVDMSVCVYLILPLVHLDAGAELALDVRSLEYLDRPGNHGHSNQSWPQGTGKKTKTELRH